MSATFPLEPLVALLESAGYARSDAPLLTLADVFLDLSGEDIRRRLYLTQDAEGRELCLRPEFTIPICMAEVQKNITPVRAAVSYCGSVFRHRVGEPGEFIQAGVESLGRTDREAADADILALALSATRSLGEAKPLVRLGDAGLINGVLEALDASPAFARRLKRGLAAGKPFAQAIVQTSRSTGLNRYGGVMAALEGAGPEAARAFVGDMLTMSGVREAGGRTAEEIASRFLSKAQEGETALDADRTRILEEFLAISGHPDQVAGGVSRLAQRHGLDIRVPLQRYETRVGFVAAAGLDLEGISASAGFVRNLDYYTGMVFEMLPHNASAVAKPLAGGGRYDGLLKRLGAAVDVPAVGFSLWVERFQRGSAT
ncbi:MAG: ATP phosphoribosyltransferase regulatory subunit [Beijerinckiaceae bacterium]